MPKISHLLSFLSLCCLFLPVFGQETLLFDSITGLQFDWQEQIMQQVDIDDLSEEAYRELLEELSDLVLWSDTATQSHSLHRVRQQVILSTNRTLNQREGYRHPTADRQQANKAYLGDPWHHSVRYRVMAGRSWQGGLSLEKDAGEPWRQQFPVFDSWHGYLSYRNTSRQMPWLRQAVVGHYRLRMGCGLLVNQGFSLGKLYMSQQLRQRSNTFTPYASNAEEGYMQGAAFNIAVGQHFTLLPYISVLQLDGTLTDRHILTSIKTDGMHRTQGEADKRNAAWQTVFGARAGWKGEWYDVGLHLMTTQLQYDYQRSPLYYNQNYFRGHQLTQFSADYRLRALGGSMQGELALDDQGGLASVHMLSHPLSRYWSATLMHRYYSPHYRQLHASSLSESSAMQGEQGVTLDLDGSLSSHWDLQLMADWFRFSQPQFGIRDDASQGFEGLTRATYKRHDNTLTLGYRIKRKGDYIRHAFDSQLTLTPTSQISLRTQLRGRIYSEKAQPPSSASSATQPSSAASSSTQPSYGYSLSQSITWNGNLSPHCPFTLNAQAAYFDTDDYDSRLYLNEKTILYGFGLPMLYGQGLRYSLTSAIHLGSSLVLELKWALTNYANRSTISSGLQQIAGNTQQDLWLQLRMKL